jgi:hypothetical protein
MQMKLLLRVRVRRFKKKLGIGFLQDLRTLMVSFLLKLPLRLINLSSTKYLNSILNLVVLGQSFQLSQIKLQSTLSNSF